MKFVLRKIGTWFYDRLSHIALIGAWLIACYIFLWKNKVKIVGRENLPHTTNILYVSNHLTWIDSFLIGVSVMNFWEMFFYFKCIPWNAADRKNFFTHPVWKHFFALLKNIPVDRGSGNRDAVKELVRNFEKVLIDSNLLLFFEGTRSRTGFIGPCISGVSETIRLVKPKYVIPIFLDWGVQSIMPIADGPRYSAIHSGKTGQVIIGKAIDFSGIDMSKHGSARKNISALVRQAVVNLQNQNSSSK